MRNENMEYLAPVVFSNTENSVEEKMRERESRAEGSFTYGAL